MYRWSGWALAVRLSLFFHKLFFMFQSVLTAAAAAGSLNAGKRWRTAALGLLLTGAAAFPARAQFSYAAGNASIASSSYAALGATATAIPVANTDDANSAPQNIGFTFNYNGQPFTQFVFSTNGFIKLGNTAPSGADLYYTDPQTYAGTSALESPDPADVNIIAPFNYDLEPGTGTVGFKMATTGTAPNRVCTIEWANVSDKALSVSKQYGNMSFQLKLHETSSQIEFTYGPTTAAAGTTPAFLGVPAGMIGNDPAAEVLVLSKASAAPWTTTIFQNTPYDATQNRLNVRANIRPVSGITYRFNATQANDINVAQIYSLGQLPIPFGAPHTASALVINAGLNVRASLAVTLTVSGANTFTNTQTLTNVAPGDTVLVTFAPYTPTATGTNTLTVTVPADDNTGNDSKTWTQQVNNDTYRYADDGAPSTSYGLNAPGLWLVKYTTSQPKALISTSVYLGNDPGIIGKRYYGILTDDQGGELARTPNYTVTAADTGSYHTFTFASTPAIAVGDFYVGMGQVTGGNEFPVGVQDEDPTRTESYFVFIPGTGLVDLAGQIPVRPMISAVLGVPAACAAPDNLSVSNVTATGALVTFDVVSGAQNYTVYYGAPGFTPGGAGSLSQTVTSGAATLSGLNTTSPYEVYVRTNCSSTSSSAINGPVSFTTTCVSSAITTFPYVQNFDTPAATQQLLCGITVVDANNDQFTWAQFNRDTLAANGLVGTPHSAPNFMAYLYTADNSADDWFFLPAIQVPTGQQLRASWWQAATFGAGQVWEERLEVKWGTAPTVAAMTNTIYPATVIDDTTYTQAFSQPISGTGTVYVGFHAISDADELMLRIDDVALDRVTGLNDARLARAVSVYPNPTAGRATVSVTETGATRVSLRVIDNLGRVVYTGTMADNAAKNIDLGHLANGLYTLKVTLDDQVVTKSLSVLK
jgi:trimeric autotransporter adhesin